MISIVQRVKNAMVAVGDCVIGQIDVGALIFLGAQKNDSDKSVEWMANRLSGLRIFEDNEGKMNLDVHSVKGSFLVVSNFTVTADTQKGRRPSFDNAASFEDGHSLYMRLVDRLKSLGVKVETGEYGAEMVVHSVIDGPVTLIVESPI
jgi:D-tyrosyl-tRNA(Tyr) deacylase